MRADVAYPLLRLLTSLHLTPGEVLVASVAFIACARCSSSLPASFLESDRGARGRAGNAGGIYGVKEKPADGPWRGPSAGNQSRTMCRTGLPSGLARRQGVVRVTLSNLAWATCEL